MIWKFWFVLGCAAYFLLMVLGHVYDDEIVFDEGLYVVSILISVGMVVGLGYFYALGWKKRLFGRMFNNGFICSLGLLILFSAATNAYDLNRASAEQNSIGVLVVSVIIFMATYIAVWVGMLSPFLVAWFKYRKRFEQFDRVDDPFWKMFAFFSLFGIVFSLIETFTFYIGHFLNDYNIWDKLAVLVCFYEILFLVGLALRKKFFNKMFWQVSSIFYLASIVPTTFYVSEQMKINSTYLDLWSWWAGVAIAGVLLVWALYKYSFTDVVFKQVSENGKEV